MEPNIQQRLDAHDAKLEQIWQSVEKTRKYFLITMWTTIVCVALPLVLLVFALPFAVNAILGQYEGVL